MRYTRHALETEGTLSMFVNGNPAHLVGHEAAAAKQAWEARFMYPFCPFRVQMAVWLLVLRLENTNRLRTKSFKTVNASDLVVPTRTLSIIHTK